MKTLKGKGLILFASLLLVACGTTDDNDVSDDMDENGAAEVVDESPDDLEENWAQYLQEGNEGLDNYGSDTYIDVSTSVGPDMNDTDQVEITMYIEGELDRGYNVVGDEELYFDGTDVYVLENGEWVYYPDEGPIDYPSWYPNIINSLLEIEELVEADYSGDEVTLTYSGNDPQIWNAFEQEFELSIDGVARNNINIDLTATMDDENYFLQSLVLDIVGTETEGEETATVSIFVEADYYDHNEVDLTDVEEDIDEDVNNSI